MLGFDLAGMPNITKVTLWLDHDKPFRWAHVNERALLSPFTNLLCNKRIEFHISLPDVHPDYEDAGRHFTAVTTTPFVLVRRPRQWHDQGQPCNDTFTMSRERNLSDMAELLHYLAEYSQHDLSRFELEKDECGYWKDGLDVEDIAEGLRDLFGLNVVAYYSV